MTVQICKDHERKKWVAERNWKGLHQHLFMSNVVLHAHPINRSNGFLFNLRWFFFRASYGIYFDFIAKIYL